MCQQYDWKKIQVILDIETYKWHINSDYEAETAIAFMHKNYKRFNGLSIEQVEQVFELLSKEEIDFVELVNTNVSLIVTKGSSQYQLAKRLETKRKVVIDWYKDNQYIVTTRGLH